MQIRNAVYELDPILDDPRYEGFGADDPFPETLPANWWDKYPHPWRVIRLRSKWVPLKVRGRVRSFNDYPTVGGINPAFSERAVEALRDFLEPNGEILPLASRIGNYFAFNVTTVADILNLRKSKVQWIDKNIIAADIERYEIIPERLTGLAIFRLNQQPSRTYVTQPFVSRAEEHGLRGMHFIKVWPLPPEVSWKELRKAQWGRRDREGLPPGQTLKGNTVVIQLGLAKKTSKGTPAEHKAIDKLMDQLDALLVDVRSDAPAIGNLEGSDYGVPGECRLFLSCPDADALVEKLRPWLKKLEWPNRAAVLKRYGNFANHEAREEAVSI